VAAALRLEKLSPEICPLGRDSWSGDASRFLTLLRRNVKKSCKGTLSAFCDAVVSGFGSLDGHTKQGLVSPVESPLYAGLAMSSTCWRVTSMLWALRPCF